MRWKTSLRERAFQFGLAVTKVGPRIAAMGGPYGEMADQLVRAASSIGAHLEEADAATSRRDMGYRQAIGLREAKESKHWLRLLIAAGILKDELTPLYQESDELSAMLTVSVRKLRRKEDVQNEATNRPV